jgi:catechol 2,3-dioxygenase-like lactoylglutathione lyase family enzyme
MQYICSLILVDDIKLSLDFYKNILNQKVKYDFGENITFHGDFAIHLKSHFQSLTGNNEIRTGVNNFELYFEHDNIEELVEKLKNKGVKFVHDVCEQPWRQKVVRFYDPDENMIEVGESMELLYFRLYNEGLDTAQISKSTNMPIEYVIAAIEGIVR